MWGIRIQDLISIDWQQYQSQSSPQRFSPTMPIPIPISVGRKGHERSLSDSGSASSFPSLGRSLNELRLHSQPITLVDDHSPAEGPQSLPSLKSSGLLESWNNSKDAGAMTWSTRPDERLLSPSRMNSKSSPHPQISFSTQTPDPDSPRTGMPIGMPWLANE
jgi:hypothetical protein